MTITITSSGYTLDSDDKTLMAAFDSDRWALLYQRALAGEKEENAAFAFLVSLSVHALEKIASLPQIELARDMVDISFPEQELETLVQDRPFLIGDEYVTHAWCASLMEQIVSVFRREIVKSDESVESYFASHKSQFRVANRIYFHLVVNKGDSVRPFAFLVTYADRKGRHIPLATSLAEFSKDQKALLSLLSPLSRIAEKSSFIASLIDTGELFHPLALKSNEAYQFLQEIPLYEEAGVYCRIPDFWKRRKQSISVGATVGTKVPSAFGSGAILDYEPYIMLSGQTLTKAELQALVQEQNGLRLIKGQWVEIDRERFASLLASFERLEKGDGITLFDLLGREMGMRNEVAERGEVSNGEWLRNLRASLTNPDTLPQSPLPKGFCGTLRPYQMSGYAYLDAMARYRLGACLADDMGLGKTVQVIAHIGAEIERGCEKVLLVVPTSLVGNWIKEFERFLPSVVPITLTGQVKMLKVMDLSAPGVYITTYPLIAKLDNVKGITWDLIAIDEAQAIKNCSSAQSKAVKNLEGKERIALTGTPVENSTGDLWSLFDFLNPGLLGSRKEFTLYAKKAQDAGSYAPLRKVISPFILRRMKSDKRIISDLPEKLVEKEYPLLSPLQEKLYTQCVTTLAEELENSEGIARKGLVLSTIMRLKQICNHPCQYSGDDEGAYKAEESGKFQLLAEVCASIASHRERVLVFTQFREIIPALDAYLASLFGMPGLVFHGGVKAAERNKLVSIFNGEHYCPYMVISLKAGGVGLNLTSANHVVHFDRWWNPAVENQATDRAFRIGQKKSVVVHTFITKGTIEEKIDTLLDEKRALSDSLLSGAGEGWITNMKDAEILRLCKLEGGR